MIPIPRFLFLIKWACLKLNSRTAHVIARCLDVELHSLVPLLIDGFMFAMPGSKARMNPTARLHAFAEIRHIRERSVSIDTVYDWNKPSA